MGKAKSKGNLFERKVASILKEITKANWQRTAYSGAAFLGNKSNKSRINDLDNSQIAF